MLQMGAHAILTICFCRVSKLGSGNKTLSWIVWSKIQDVHFVSICMFFSVPKTIVVGKHGDGWFIPTVFR